MTTWDAEILKLALADSLGIFTSNVIQRLTFELIGDCKFFYTIEVHVQLEHLASGPYRTLHFSRPTCTSQEYVNPYAAYRNNAMSITPYYYFPGYQLPGLELSEIKEKMGGQLEKNIKNFFHSLGEEKKRIDFLRGTGPPAHRWSHDRYRQPGQMDRIIMLERHKLDNQKGLCRFESSDVRGPQEF